MQEKPGVPPGGLPCVLRDPFAIEPASCCAYGGAPLQRCSLGFGNEPALATEGTETLPQALKRDPGTDGRYARLKGVLHPSPIHQM